MCLDVLRVMKRGPRLLDAVISGMENDLGADAPKMLDVLRAAADIAVKDEGSARIFIEQLALTAAAAELRHSFGGELSDAFAESRLAGPWRSTYGMLDARYNASGIVDYAYPPLPV